MNYFTQYQGAHTDISRLIDRSDGLFTYYFDRLQIGVRHQVPDKVAHVFLSHDFSPLAGFAAVGRSCFLVEGPIVANSARRGLVDQNLGIEYTRRGWPLNHADLVVFAGNWRGQWAVVKCELDTAEIYLAPIVARSSDVIELAYRIVAAEVLDANEIAESAVAHYIVELSMPAAFTERRTAPLG